MFHRKPEMTGLLRIGMLCLIGTCGLSRGAWGQPAADAAWTWRPLIRQALSDSGLVDKEVQIIQYGVPAGRVDTVAHRHPGELFVYVQTGAIEYQKDDEPPELYESGSVLYEPPYSLHTLFRNPSETEEARLVLIYIATKGKPLTIREHR